MSGKKTMRGRIARSLKFEKSVYKEVADDTEATGQAILVPIVMEIAVFAIAVVSAIPLAYVNVGGCPQCVTQQITESTVRYGMLILPLFVLFLVWVLLLYLVARFAGVRDLRVKQLLRAMGFAFSPLFLLAFFIVATLYSTTVSDLPISAQVFSAGMMVTAFLILINSVVAFREVTGMTSGVSIMSNFLAVVIGIALLVLAVPSYLAILEVLKSLL